MKAAVIILNWNGEKLLREFLPSVVANTDPSLGHLIVADNGSDDGSLKLLAERFPSVEVLAFPENACACKKDRGKAAFIHSGRVQSDR